MIRLRLTFALRHRLMNTWFVEWQGEFVQRSACVSNESYCKASCPPSQSSAGNRFPLRDRQHLASHVYPLRQTDRARVRSGNLPSRAPGFTAASIASTDGHQQELLHPVHQHKKCKSHYQMQVSCVPLSAHAAEGTTCKKCVAGHPRTVALHIRSEGPAITVRRFCH